MAKTKQKQLSAKDYTRKRIIGTEQEYGIWSLDEDYWNANLDRFLSNGGFIYEDCDHPEYASPESSNPLDAVKYSKAGESCVRKLVKNCTKHDFFKHVSDADGGSFGAHESYSLKISSSHNFNFLNFFNETQSFFATRPIYAGAGRINNYPVQNYEISQRSERIKERLRGSSDSKAFFTIKDEFNSSRLHVTCGDANMSEVAEYLKLGTTALVLDLAEDKKLKKAPRIYESLSSFKTISEDLTLKRRLPTSFGEMTAIEIQKYYLELAQANYKGRDKMTDDILTRWKFVLNTLKTDPMKLDRQIDWVIKKRLIDSYMNKTGRGLSDTSVKNIDLMYHHTDKNKSLFYILQNKRLIDRMLTDEQIKFAVHNAPEDTRAWIRGVCIKKNKGKCEGPSLSDWVTDWDYVTLNSKKIKSLKNPFHNYSELEKELYIF